VSATPASGLAATPSTNAAAPPFGNAALGGDGPVHLEYASPAGSFVALCQARADTKPAAGADAGPAAPLTSYLIAPGEELALDAWVLADPTGRYAVVQRAGVLELWDSASQQALDLAALGADVRFSTESFDAARTLSFDSSGQRLLYVRRGASGTRIVLRSLNEGTERELDPGQAEVWRARFSRTGSFIIAEVLSVDSNKNGKVDYPAPLSTTLPGCASGPARFHAWVDRGDRPEVILIPDAGGAIVRDPQMVLPVGDGYLSRDDNGALFLVRAGKKQLLEPAECKGRPLYVDASRELFVFGCAQKKKTGRVSLELVTRAGRKPLNIELASVELDRDGGEPARLVPFYPGLDSVLLDADRRELLPLQTGDVVVATLGPHALVRRNRTLVLYDAETRSEQPLPGLLDKNPDVLRQLPYVFVSPSLVDIETGRVLGESRVRPLALSNRGALLVPDANPRGSALPRGPLRWLTLGQ